MKLDNLLSRFIFLNYQYNFHYQNMSFCKKGGTIIYNTISQLAEKYEDEIIKLRRHFHAHPELSWKEVETTQKIIEILKELGYSIIQVGFGDTESGVVAEIGGAENSTCIALRADIDCLPLKEETGLPFASINDYMHACGHDAHTAMLLGAAYILADMKNELKGRVRLIFQPAEEHGIKSGALAMIKEGALENVNAAVGLHIWAPIPAGKVAYRKGAIMASADGWYLRIKGKGGHGSSPELSVDPTIAASKIVTALHTIVSREIDPQETAVVSLGGLQTNSNSFNIIPDSVTMNGTVRTFNPEVQDHIEEAIHRIVKGECLASRCEGKLDYKRFLPATINDPDMISMAMDVAAELIGKENVEECRLVMGSEDFSYFGQHVPSAFFFLGAGNPEKGINFPHHHPKFQIDEDVLKTGSALLAGIACHYLSHQSNHTK